MSSRNAVSAGRRLSPMSPASRIGFLFFLLIAAAAAGCSRAPEQAAAGPLAVSAGQGSPERSSRGVVRAPAERKPEIPRFEYAYQPPESADLQPIYERVVEVDLWRQLPEVQAIDGMFVLPRRLRFVTAQCDGPGALYRPDEAEVVLCYETLRILYERGQEHQQALGLGDDHPLRYLSANVRFMVLHEVGHALVDLLDLPVTGSQEDAVDQLAAILMLRFAGLDETPAQVIENLGMAANWMLSRSTGAYNLDAFASTHSLGEQRYFSLQCMIYGTDPAGFANMIATGELTAERAEGCEREMHLITRAWLRLLLPHLAPGYELYDEAARQYIEVGG